LKDSIAEIKNIKPKRTLFVGMNHSVDHEEVNTLLKTYKEKEGIDVQLAFDGMRIALNTN
jgi:hypothetical protein